MAKKAAKRAAIGGEMTSSMRPDPRMSLDLHDMPDGMPSVGKPVTMLVQGELTRLSKNEYGYTRDATIGMKVKKVTVAKGK